MLLAENSARHGGYGHHFKRMNDERDQMPEDNPIFGDIALSHLISNVQHARE